MRPNGATALNALDPIAVIGTGAMGSGIAQVAAAAGHPVYLYDAQPASAGRAKEAVAASLARLVTKGKISSEFCNRIIGRLVPIDSLEPCRNASLVIEAIVEDLQAKRALFGDLEKIVGPDCVLATNTSSISITAIAAGLSRPDRVVGMHFFNPAPVMSLVEVVSGLATAPAVAETLFATALAWGKTPVHAKSTPGFIVNRVARPYYAESLRLLGERAANPHTIDELMRETGGFRMGPFELMDLIGHDVNFAVTHSVYEAYFHDPRFTPSLIQRELVAAGFLGRKSGRGFYDYPSKEERPASDALPSSDARGRVTLAGSPSVIRSLVDRVREAGIDFRSDDGSAFPSGPLRPGHCVLALTDGRTATARAAASGVRNTVVFDLALDYASVRRLGLAKADQCSEEALGAAVGLLKTAGVTCTLLDDAPGLAVMRTVAMLANEAADAVNQGVCSVIDVDSAMQNGVNYPVGPLAWADRIGLDVVRAVLANLAAHYGEDRYRISPLIQRKAYAGGRFHE